MAIGIDVFNSHYACAYVVAGKVMHLVEPVEILKAVARLRKIQCEEAAGEVRYEQLLADCRCFRQFDADFAALVSAPT